MKRLLFLLLLLPLFVHAQTWVPVGNPEFTVGQTQYPSMAVTGGEISAGRTIPAAPGTVYVAYEDFANGARASVMKYDGGSWVYAGNPGFSADAVGFTQIAVDAGGTPYVVYEDAAYNGGAATVMKLDSSGWVNVGDPGFSAGQINWAGIAIDSSGLPYVAYSDFSLGGRVVVMRYNGTNWVNVGAPGFSSGEALYEAIVIAPDGTPYVSMGDGGYSTYARVMKFNGSSWVDVGAPAFSAGAVGWTSIAIDTGGTVYTAYSDASLNLNAVVMKFNGGSWVSVGAPGFSDSEYVQYTSMAIAPNGIPYVVYENGNGFATAKKFNGSDWVNAGNPDFSASTAGGTAIIIAGGIPYVVYGDGVYDGAYSGKITVMELDNSITATVQPINAAATGLSLFPNPTSTSLTISATDKITTIAISNLLGQAVYSQHHNSPQVQIDVAGLPAGVYFVKINGTEVRKFVKE